jgi:hypothetical protein
MNVYRRKRDDEAPPRDVGIWHKFKHARPGERFVKLREHRKRMPQGDCPAEKCVNILGGSLLAIFGILLIPAPGPGSLFFGIGMALLGTEFLFIARAMDVAELKARELLAEVIGRWRYGLRR